MCFADNKPPISKAFNTTWPGGASPRCWPRRRAVEAVIVLRFDRLAGCRWELLRTLGYLDGCGMNFISVEDRFDTTSLKKALAAMPS
jgi:hypothetical protein